MRTFATVILSIIISFLWALLGCISFESSDGYYTEQSEKTLAVVVIIGTVIISVTTTKVMFFFP